jgi:3-hydroxyacyl-CoA dehydrogenase
MSHLPASSSQSMSKPGTDTAGLDLHEGGGLLPGGVAVITLDHFPVNSISARVSSGVVASVIELEKRIARGEVKGVIVRGAGRCFCAGADISAFGTNDSFERVTHSSKKSEPYGLEELNVPVVAAIHGFALGGGFELSLACHYRVIASDATVGLPEVNIGLLPGGQGTQRLPRLIGCEEALKAMTSGAPLSASRALKAGLVEAVAPPAELLEAALKLVHAKAVVRPPRRICELPPPTPVDLNSWRGAMRKARPGEPAPQAIIACVEACCGARVFATGVAEERRQFGPLVSSAESVALRAIFFAERAAPKVEGLAARAAPIRSVGVVGAGLMGGGIAMCCANAGIATTLLDMDEKGLARGLVCYSIA